MKNMEVTISWRHPVFFLRSVFRRSMVDKGFEGLQRRKGWM